MKSSAERFLADTKLSPFSIFIKPAVDRTLYPLPVYFSLFPILEIKSPLQVIDLQILGSFPQNFFTQFIQVFQTFGDGKEVIAGQLADLAGK